MSNSLSCSHKTAYWRSCAGIPSNRKPSSRSLQTRAQSNDLNQRIAEFYDSSSGLWEDIWGEHMHHGSSFSPSPAEFLSPGIYRSENPPASHKQAQLDLIEEVIQWANIQSPKRVLDVGCGIGGSSRYLARKYGCEARGVTLSPEQQKRATELTKEAGLEDSVSFDVCDALDLTFPDNSFDLVWSLESGEHMPDKRKFVSEMVRVLEPGGRLVVVTWCHRRLRSRTARSASLGWDEKLLLDLINRAYALPEWVSIETYEDLFEEFDLSEVNTADWSSLVEPFWGAVIGTALTPKGIQGLLRAGPKTISGAAVMPLMQLGFKMDTIKFVLITGKKKSS